MGFPAHFTESRIFRQRQDELAAAVQSVLKIYVGGKTFSQTMNFRRVFQTIFRPWEKS